MHQIKRWLHSVGTLSYWRYTFVSEDAVKTFFSIWGAIWLCLETSDYFQLTSLSFKKDGWWFLAFAILVVMWTRRPVTRICYKLPTIDAKIEIRVADIFNVAGDIVISTNTTFDTDLKSGLIAPNSLQGKFTNTYYDGDVSQLDRDLDTALAGINYDMVANPAGKSKKYKVGTVAKLRAKNRLFYLLAMADMNEHGNAQSSLGYIKSALKELWDFMTIKGELGEIVIPLLGTGRGRVTATREEIIKVIVKSFASAIQNKRFATKLTIVIHPEDYRQYDLNLFELHDYLRHVHKYERTE